MIAYLVLIRPDHPDRRYPIRITGCGHPVYPRLGEAIDDFEVRYIVADVSWNARMDYLIVTALYKEDEK